MFHIYFIFLPHGVLVWYHFTVSLGKGKFHPRTGHEDPEGELTYSSTFSLTSAVDGVGGQRHAVAALPWERPIV